MIETYVSNEDSELLRKAVTQLEGSTSLEIGVGYGSNLLDLENRFETVAGTDIYLTEAFRRFKGGKADLFVTDRASCFRDEVFDLVIMNPPYLPSERVNDITVDGGKDGFEIPKQFLLEAMRVLRPKGVGLIVLSSETSYLEYSEFCKEHQLKIKEVLFKDLFFERLTVYEIRRILSL